MGLCFSCIHANLLLVLYGLLLHGRCGIATKGIITSRPNTHTRHNIQCRWWRELAVNLPKTSPTCEEEFLVLGTFKTQTRGVWDVTQHNLPQQVFFFSSFFVRTFYICVKSHQAAASHPVGFLQSVDGHLQGEVNATRCSRLKYQCICFLSPSHCSDWGPTQIALCLQACK